MTRVRFVVNFEELTGVLSTTVIPIEIRRLDLALVYRGLSTEKLDLNEGTYFVTSKLPDGRRLFAYAEVTTHKKIFVLSRDPDYDANELKAVEFGSTLKNPDTNLLLHYLATGYLREAVTLAKSEYSPAFAYRDRGWFRLALYTLLRINELKELEGMLESDWLRYDRKSPDTLAIRGEILARLGRHDEAFETFLELGFSGLPDFTDGVFYATQRLKIYRDVLPMESLENEMGAYAILRRLQRVVTYHEPGSLILAFTSEAPVELDSIPDSRDMEEEAEAYPLIAGDEVYAIEGEAAEATASEALEEELEADADGGSNAV